MRSSSIAVGDFNNDGYEDFYLGFPAKNQLWKNLGDGRFSEMAETAGVALANNSDTKTAIWGDIDNDGDLDLYVGNNVNPDKLFRNNGNETFTDITTAAGIFQLGYPLSVNMADVNRDGFLTFTYPTLIRRMSFTSTTVTAPLPIVLSSPVP
ncbi:MAG: VCBS repeat-containing protein [Lewinellaceae bacterium]|nr:VCBS repeat-containing protein [Lewinellaceae bacterium]